MAQFTNRAQLLYGGNVIQSNETVGELVGSLEVRKTAVSDSYVPGGQVAYIVEVINSGNTDITGLTLTDNMGEYTLGTTPTTVYPLSYVSNSVKLFGNGTLRTPPTVAEGDRVVFSGMTLPANSNLQLIYEADVNDFAPLGTGASIVNRVTATGAGITTPVSDIATVTPTGEPILAISKSMEPQTVVENDTLTYTFVIQNTGNTEAGGTDLSISDTFNPALDNLTVTLNGQPFTAYQYGGALGEGVFQTNAGAITVPAAEYTQNPQTGGWSTAPGTTVLTVSGTVSGAIR